MIVVILLFELFYFDLSMIKRWMQYFLMILIMIRLIQFALVDNYYLLAIKLVLNSHVY